MNKQDTIPEAVASVTYSLETPDGFNILFTVRNDSGTTLLELMRKTIEPELKFQGYKPQVKGSFGGKAKPPAEVVPDRKCPTCQSPLVYGTTKDGRKYIKCSTQRYDFASKSVTGCPYFQWQDQQNP